ncbi:hypothetical protein FLCU109888_06675 [Flavobacterium cucumis]|uniref:Uncharacterized protein n=1 Tax=Flavobacterium cucumis TaxID=416016 RepID=A0A1M7ZXH7_9FLAO|nr:hypothetical protein [Flavobacterium cucumis]SHO73566.1 hypothetical protein SAMN05443547_1928 [Flavobacterium cucumis]
MGKSEILYEPLPIGRIGIKKSTEEVIITNDFSGFAQMLEEYICLGATKIIMPSSSPEISTLNQMPILLSKRIKIVNDEKEIETVNRLLHNLRKEFRVEITEETNFLKFPKNTSREIITHIDRIHLDIKRLAMEFNHNIQIPLNHELSLKSLSFLRTKIYDSTSRIILAQLEAILNYYEKVEFESFGPQKNDLPSELMTIFDKLINDENYLLYSDSITELSSPLTRESAKLKLKELSRIIATKSYTGKAWDYFTKTINAWKGIPLPESKDLANLINGDNLPALVNLNTAKNRALEIWNNTNLNAQPLRRDGLPLGDNDILWLPPIGKIEVRAEDDRTRSFGTVKALKEALDKFQIELEKDNKKRKKT